MKSRRPCPPVQEKPIKRSLQLIIGLIISGIGLYFSFRDVDVLMIMKGMWRAKVSLVVLSAGLYGVAFIFRSIRWQFLLKPLGKISLTRVFFALMFGFFVNEILPLRVGEVARAMLIAGWMSIPLTASVGTIVAERLGDLSILFIVCLLVSLGLPNANLPTKPLALTLLIAALLCSVSVRRAETLIASEARNPWMKKSIRALGRFLLGLRQIGDVRNASKLFASSVGVWTFDLLAMNVLGRAYGLSLSAAGTGALIIGIAIGVMLPAAPGYIGTYEYFGEKTLRLVGVPTQVALTYVVSLHFLQMIMIALFGLPVLIRFGIPQMKPHKSAHTDQGG